MDTKYYLIAGIIFLIFILGGFVQKSYGIFSVMNTKENCENWLARMNLEGQTDKATLPLCLTTSIGEKWVTELNATTSGCEITYKKGCNPDGLFCEVPTFYGCSDGSLVKRCSCINDTYTNCIQSPEAQCAGEK